VNGPTHSFGERQESFEVSELRALRKRHPELAPAVDLQLELLEIQRRVLPRISLPASLPLNDWIPAASASSADPLLTWDTIPIEWSAFRSVLRETADALLRSGDLEPTDAQFLTGLVRDGDRLRVFAEAWFRDRLNGDSLQLDGLEPQDDRARARDTTLDNVLSLAFRPFLSRCAEVVAPRVALGGDHGGRCPLCAGEPELSIQSRTRHRWLVCGRCGLRWPFPEMLCPFCDNGDPDRLPSFTSADRVYWLLGCDVCRRYIKAIDERHAHRPAMPSVDAIATLPLDALAIQRGYRG